MAGRTRYFGSIRCYCRRWANVSHLFAQKVFCITCCGTYTRPHFRMESDHILAGSGSVGVGGYILGGGLSFLSTQYGWASNNLAAIELVLANGTIITASETANSGVFAAIKGGGSNFGVVTAYILQAYPIGQIWGGNLIFLGDDDTDSILSAVRNFTENYDDPKAGIIVTSELTLWNSTNLWVLFLFYDGEQPPVGVFDEFLALDPTINSCKTQAYGDLLKANDLFVLHGSVYTIGTETTPLPPANRPDIMRAYYDHWHATAASASDVLGLVASLAFQPVPKSLAAAASSKGGDLLDIDDDVDRMIFELGQCSCYASSSRSISSCWGSRIWSQISDSV